MAAHLALLILRLGCFLKKKGALCTVLIMVMPPVRAQGSSRHVSLYCRKQLKPAVRKDLSEKPQ